MDAIEASSAGVKDMADGSLRITLEFEPRFAREAYSLFGARGTPVAVAALKAGYLSKNDEKLDTSAERVQKTAETEHEKPKGGPLAKLSGMWANDPEFWGWLTSMFPENTWNADTAAEYIRGLCGVESRSELDHDQEAAAIFHNHIRAKFQKYLFARGIVR